MENIKEYLPKKKLIQLRNECDRFGFSYIISKKNNMKDTPIAKCSWVHGWHWYPLKINDILKGSEEYIKRSKIVVATKLQENDLSEYINPRNIVVAGLPFSYVQKPKIPRNKGSVVAFLPKSLKENDEHIGAIGFIDYLIKNRERYREPTICIFGGDAHRENIIQYIEKNGFSYIIGADPQDVNSLLRIKIIFSYFEYAIGPTIGSYLPYAHATGCKAFIVENFVRVSMIKESQYHERHYIMEKYPFLFKDDLNEFELYEEWGNEEIGSRFVLHEKKVKEIFGWTLNGALQHYYRAVRSRIHE